MAMEFTAIRKCLGAYAGRRKLLEIRRYSQLPRINIQADEVLKRCIAEEDYKARKHPGVMLRGKVVLPNEFMETADDLISKTGTKKAILTDSEELSDYLYCRKRPIEKGEYRSICARVESEVRSRDAFLEPFLSTTELDKLEAKRFNQIKQQLKRRIYHWEPIRYSKLKGMHYLAGRSAPEYAVLYKIFYEIAMRDPNFKPVTLLDFGSGVGTVLWAANAFWQKTLNEHYCVDASGEMNDLAELMLKKGTKNNQTVFPNVFFRQFLPASTEVKFDLVTSAYSLLELSSRQARLEVLNTLWRKSSNYVVIVERGNTECFEAVNEAREFLLHLDKGGTSSCHVFSPCPHDTYCGKIVNNDTRPCVSSVHYRKFYPRDKEFIVTEKFSYVVIKKGPRPSTTTWPRLIEDPLKKSKHVICRLCSADGSIGEAIVTKNKHSSPVYQAVKQSRRGDLVPMEKLEMSSLKSDETINFDRNSDTVIDDDRK